MGIALSEVFDSRAAQASYHKAKLVHGFTIGRVACRDGGQLSPTPQWATSMHVLQALSSLSESGVILQVCHILTMP